MSDASPQFEEVKIPLPDRLHDLDSVPGVLGVPEWWPTGSRVAVVLARASADEDPLIDSLQRELTAKKVLTLSLVQPPSSRYSTTHLAVSMSNRSSL